MAENEPANPADGRQLALFSVEADLRRRRLRHRWAGNSLDGRRCSGRARSITVGLSPGHLPAQWPEPFPWTRRWAQQSDDDRRGLDMRRHDELRSTHSDSSPSPMWGWSPSSSERTKMDGISALTRAMREVVAPKSPPRLSKDGAAVGLSFLDTSLRQNHVRRVTERLRCSEVDAVHRVVEIDISLNLLDRGQWAASRKLNELRERSVGVHSGSELIGPASRQDEQTSDETLWVPIWRVPRRAVAPINVRDSSGTRLPRLTQYESSRLLAAGMYRLLRSILRSRQVEAGSDIDRFLHKSDKSRWIVQSALIALFTEQSGILGIEDDSWRTGGTGQHGPTSSTRTRDQPTTDALDLAEKVLKDYASDGYRELLDIALSEYILVVALHRRSNEHTLAFDSPVNTVPARKTRRGDAYVVRYEQTLPANLRAYHLVAEVDEGVEIRGMAAVTNADETVAVHLRQDIRHLIDSASTVRTSAELREYWQLELLGAIERLSELKRRRTWEARAAGGQLRAGSFRSTQELVEKLEPLAAGQSTPSSETVQLLETVEQEIAAASLGCSLSIENDPSSATAHAYWRRIPSRSVDAGRMNLVATMKLHDATDAKGTIVAWYALAVSLIGFLVLAATDWGRSNEQADAAVAILLLVPGFLYYRLELPRRILILARLQAIPRFVARVCLASMVALSILILGGWSGRLRSIVLLLSLGLPLAGFLILVLRMQLAMRRDASPSTAGSGVERRLLQLPDWYEDDEERAHERLWRPVRESPDLTLRSGESAIPDCGAPGVDQDVD
jgi:hypothetical protein